MPRGVAKDFLSLLSAQRVSARSRAIVLATLAALLAIPAWFLWPPYGLAVHAGVLVVGGLLGWGWALRTVHAYEDSLRGTWNRWMDLAPACENVPELHRKVRGRTTTYRVYVIAALLTLLWALEVLLLAVALAETTAAMVAAPVIAANALLVGGLGGHQIRLLTWTGAFRRSLDDMVQEGEIGIWGAM